MSMRYYCLYLEGMYIGEKEIEVLNNKFPQEDGDIYSIWEKYLEEIGFESFSDTEGEILTLDHTELSMDDSFYLLPLDKVSTLYEAAYASEEEVVDEVRQKVKHIFGEDYNYKSCIGLLEGTIFG